MFSSAGRLVRSHEFVDYIDVAIDAAGFVCAVRYASERNSFSIIDEYGQVIHTMKVEPFLECRNSS